MKTSEERQGMAGGVDLVALWETGDNLGGAPVFKGKAKPGANRWARRAGGLSMNWAAIAAGLMVLTMVPFLAQEGSRPPALNEGPGGDSVLGVDPFVAEAGGGAMSPGYPSDGSDVERAKDPSLMVLGPERPGIATAASPASAPTAPAPKQAGGTDWASALKNAVRTAAPAAVKKAGLPSPSARLAGALKAIAAGAGSSASKSSSEPLRLSAPSSKDLLSSFKAMDSLQLRRSEPLMRSTARGGSTPSSISQGGATFNSSARPSGGASASENLRDAVAAFGSPSANGQGGGGPAVFDGGRGPGANPAGVAKAPGESLEFQRKKMEMEKEMDLKFAKRKYNELGRQEMLDKVKAESSAKMKETIAGKMIDGAFGMAQKAMGGEGGGKGQSAVESAERAEAERQRMPGARAPLQDSGEKVGQAAEQVKNDRYLGSKFTPPLQAVSAKARLAGSASENADAVLENGNRSVIEANKATAQANASTERQVAAAEKYAEAAKARISAWNIQMFNPGAPVGQMLGQESDAQKHLAQSDRSRQVTDQSIQTAQAILNAAPQTTQPEEQAMTRAVGQVAAASRDDNPSLGAAPDAVRQVGGRLGVSNGTTRQAIASTREASASSADARQLAGMADTGARSLRSSLMGFDQEMNTTAKTLKGLSMQYQEALIPKPLYPDYVQMSLLEGQFFGLKTQTDISLEARKAQIPQVKEQLKSAKTRLDKSGG